MPGMGAILPVGLHGGTADVVEYLPVIRNEQGDSA
jgi:hypothetical protein